MRVLVLNGPNLSSLGRRQPDVYGTTTLAEIRDRMLEQAAGLRIEVRWEQSNHEGALIDIIEQEEGRSDACVINPGALAHTSVALADALRGFTGPVVEVHLSNIFAREEYRRSSHVAGAATAVITGAGAAGYALALQAAVQLAGVRTRETTG